MDTIRGDISDREVSFWLQFLWTLHCPQYPICSLTYSFFNVLEFLRRVRGEHLILIFFILVNRGHE